MESFDNKDIYICVFNVSASEYDECVMNEFNTDDLNKLKLNLGKINLGKYQSGLFTIISRRY